MTVLGSGGCLRLTQPETGATADATGTPTATGTQSPTETGTSIATETRSPTETGTPTATPDRLVDGFDSGAYDDGDPVTWSVTSPGEEIAVRDDLAVEGSGALVMLSGADAGNPAELSHRAPDRTLTDGASYGAWLRTDTGGRAYYRLGTRSEPDGPHELSAGVLADEGQLQIRTTDADGQELAATSLASGAADTWYRFVLEPRPAEQELDARAVDRDGRLLGTGTVATTGETAVEYTTLHVPRPNGEQVLGRFDGVTLRA